MTVSNINIKHDILGQLFHAKVKGGTAELRYRRKGDDWLDFYSTTVPEPSRGFGIATQLVATGLKFARQQHLKVKPTCPFVKDYLERHQEDQELVI